MNAPPATSNRVSEEWRITLSRTAVARGWTHMKSETVLAFVYLERERERERERESTLLSHPKPVSECLVSYTFATHTNSIIMSPHRNHLTPVCG